MVVTGPGIPASTRFQVSPATARGTSPPRARRRFGSAQQAARPAQHPRGSRRNGQGRRDSASPRRSTTTTPPMNGFRRDRHGDDCSPARVEQEPCRGRQGVVVRGRNGATRRCQVIPAQMSIAEKASREWPGGCEASPSRWLECDTVVNVAVLEAVASELTRGGIGPTPGPIEVGRAAAGRARAPGLRRLRAGG